MAKLVLNFENKFENKRSTRTVVVMAVAVVGGQGYSREKRKTAWNTTSHFLFAFFIPYTITYSTCQRTVHWISIKFLLLLLLFLFSLVNYVRMTHHFYVKECARTFPHRQQPSKKSFERKWLFKWYTICIHDFLLVSLHSVFCLFSFSFTISCSHLSLSYMHTLSISECLLR